MKKNKQCENTEILEKLRQEILKNGIPVNVRHGNNEELADYITRTAAGINKYETLKEYETAEAKQLERTADIGLLEITPEIQQTLLKASKALMKEVAAGTEQDAYGYEKCPVCRRTVGTSGFYCKWCGQKMREKS